MSSNSIKQESQKMIENLPEDISWDDIMYEIYDFIAADSENYAQKVIDKLTKATEQLSRFPESGRYVPEIDDKYI